MGLYYLNEAAFELPDGFVDKTVHVLDSPKGVGLMLSRAQMPEGKSLRDMVEQHLEHESKTLKAHAVLSRTETTLSGNNAAQPAIDVATRCRTERGMQYARQVHLVYRGIWLVLTVTGDLSERATCDDHAGRVLSTVRFRE